MILDPSTKKMLHKSFILTTILFLIFSMLGIQPAKASTPMKLNPVKQLNVQKNNNDGTFSDVNNDPDIFILNIIDRTNLKFKSYGSMTFSGIDTTKNITSAILKLQVANDNNGKESKLRINLGSNSTELTAGFPALVESMWREVTVPKHQEPRLYQIDVKDFLESLSPADRANPIFIMSSDSSNMNVVKLGNSEGSQYNPYLEVTYGTGANSAPTNISLNPSSIEENKPAGTTVGTLIATDPDAGETFTYTLVIGAGDTDNSIFTIAGNQLQTNKSFDYETKNSYSIRVRVTDSAGNPFEKQLTISIIDVNENTAPTIVSLLPANNAMNVPISSNLIMAFSEAVTKGSGNIYIVRASDNTIMQTIDVASASVGFNGTTVTIDPPANLASGEAYYVQIDAGTFKNATQQDFQGISDKTTWRFTTVTLSSNANLSGLSISSGTLSPAFASGTTSYTASVGSSIAGVNVTPTVADSNARVRVNGINVSIGNSSNITLNPGNNTVTIVVTAQDNSTKTYTLTIHRALANEPAPTVTSNIVTPEDTLSGKITITEGASTTQYFKISNIIGGRLYRSDGVTEIVSNDFITKAEGNAGLKFMPNANANGNTGFGFNVQAARDNAGAGLSSVMPVAIKVSEVNDAPIIVNPISNQTIIAGKSKTIDISNTFSDVDGDTLTFIAISYASTIASVQLNNQQLTVEGKAVGTATITLAASDGQVGSAPTSFTVDVTNTNPVFPSPTVNVTTLTGVPVTGNVAATDTDGHTLTYDLKKGAPNGAVSFSTGSAQWTYKSNPGFVGKDSFEIQASDNYGGTAVVTVNITVTAPSHTVSFNVDGGSAVADQTVVSGGKATTPPAPTKAGYTFGGWYTSSALTTVFDFNGAITADTVVYAKWTVIPVTDTEAVAKAKAALAIGYSTGDSATSVTQKLTLPVTGIEGTTVSWTSSNPTVVSASGNVQRPSVGNSTVVLTATIVKGKVKETKQFTVVVKGYNDSYPPDTSTPDSSPSDSTPTPPSNTEQIVLDVVSGSGGVVSKALIKRTKNADGTFNDVVTLTEQSAREAVARLKEQGIDTARIVLPDLQDKANEIYVSIPNNVVAIFKDGKVNLEMVINNARIMIPASSFETFTEDLYFRVVPTKGQQSEILERARKEASALEGVDSAVIHVLGRPMKIETNMQNRSVELTLPLPADVTQEQLDHLAIYIEHSDGTKEIVSGKVVTLAGGKLGIQFTVQKFSTFSVLYMPKNEVVEEEVTEEIVPEKQVPYILGYNDGTFRPNAHITRAQMAAMLARNLSDNDVPASSEISFADTAASWAKDDIEYVRTQGLMTGRTDGKFGPNESITRAQMAAIAMRWIDKQCGASDTATYCTANTTKITFNDVDSQHWAVSYIEKISARGIMTGVNAATFNPEGLLTRAQAVKVLNRLFERELTTNKVPLFSDVPSNHWAFDEIQAAK